ncbi:Hypothetical predicted protein [Paramuricea clavata]|uniref:Reverse transcriptase zinc-binding domain-containing protein n=1 Tax=Paramuricea clavata TaxID=317549 RepID=A0A6S7HR47_PARCT|nr:Hypothetical predicted protein [Paramuricea clavata]
MGFENIDPVVNQYIRKWLEIPISRTLSTVFLTRNKFGQSIYPPSVKFIQCQTVLRKALKLSPNQSINELWKSTNTHTNIQYDFYNSTKEVLKDFRSEHEDKLQNQLTCQGSFFSSVTKFSLSHLSKVWSTAQSKLPKTIYNFTIRYINNSLPTRKNLSRWGLSSSSECSFCLGPESLLHVVAGCRCYLDRFTWRHNSILNFLANTLQTVNGSALYADVPGFKSPSILTGDTYRPDLLLSLSNGSLYVVELTVGYETNLENNVNRKKAKYKELVKQLNENFNEVNFINLSMSSLGIFAQECSTFLEMLGNVGLDKNYQTYCVRKMMTIAIRKDRLRNQLTCQGSFFTNITKFSLSKLTKLWSTCQSNLPKNIFNFTVRFNNSLPTRQNLARWAISTTSECTYCLAPETLLHVVAGCQLYLERYTWRHDSVLNFFETNLQTVSGSCLYVDLPGYKSPSIITGDCCCSDLLLSASSGCLYIVELTVGYESNLEKNVQRKKAKYSELIREQSEYYEKVKFINISISSLGVFAKECLTFMDMLNDLGFDKNPPIILL